MGWSWAVFLVTEAQKRMLESRCSLPFMLDKGPPTASVSDRYSDERRRHHNMCSPFYRRRGFEKQASSCGHLDTLAGLSVVPGSVESVALRVEWSPANDTSATDDEDNIEYLVEKFLHGAVESGAQSRASLMMLRCRNASETRSLQTDPSGMKNGGPPRTQPFVPMSAARIGAAMAAAKREEQQSKRAELRAPAEQWRRGYEDPEAVNADDSILSYCWWVQGGSEGHDAVVKNCLPGCSFTGSKQGWEFKTGALGLWYYRQGSREATEVTPSPVADISKVDFKSVSSSGRFVTR